jgi:hypothetical protein
MTDKTGHRYMIEIERRFLRDVDVDEWTKEDHEAYHFLFQIINTLDGGDSFILQPDEREVKIDQYIKQYFEEIKQNG